MPLPLTGLRNDDDLFKESTMTFGEHLEELRSTLFRSLIGLTLAFIVGLCIGDKVVKFFETPIVDALRRYYTGQAKGDFIGTKYFVDKAELAAQLSGTPMPERPEHYVVTEESLVPVTFFQRIEDSRILQMTTLNAQEAFMMYMKASFIAAVVLSSPWVFYQIWMFIAAGLYPHEKKYVHLFLPISLGLFLAGASLAFFFVFAFVLDFLFYFNKLMNLAPEVRLSEWLSFVLILPIGFGISFQLPLVMLFLERIHVFTVEKYLSNWRISILAIFVISMVLTPADPYSMLLMAVPLCVLYYLGIALCKWMPKIESPFAIEERERARLEQEKMKV